MYRSLLATVLLIIAIRFQWIFPVTKTEAQNVTFKKVVRRAFVLGHNLYFIEEKDTMQHNIYFYNLQSNYLSYSVENINDLFDGQMSSVYSLWNTEPCDIIKSGCKISDPFSVQPIKWTVNWALISVHMTNVYVNGSNNRFEIGKFRYGHLVDDITNQTASSLYTLYVNSNRFQGIREIVSQRRKMIQLKSFEITSRQSTWNSSDEQKPVVLLLVDDQRKMSHSVACHRFSMLIDQDHTINTLRDGIILHEHSHSIEANMVYIQAQEAMINCTDMPGCQGKQCMSYWLSKKIHIGRSRRRRQRPPDGSTVDKTKTFVFTRSSTDGAGWRTTLKSNIRESDQNNLEGTGDPSDNSTTTNHHTTTVKETIMMSTASMAKCDGFYTSQCSVMVMGRLADKAQTLAIKHFKFRCERGCWFCDEVCRPYWHGKTEKLSDVPSTLVSMIGFHEFQHRHRRRIWIRRLANTNGKHPPDRFVLPGGVELWQSVKSVTSVFYYDDYLYVLVEGDNQLIRINDTVIYSNDYSSRDKIDMHAESMIPFSEMVPGYENVLLGDVVDQIHCENCTRSLKLLDDNAKTRRNILYMSLALSLLAIVVIMILIYLG